MFRSLSSFLASLFRRDGLATVGKVFLHAFSPKAWRWLVSGIRNRRLVKASGLVDENWYRREYPEVAEKGIDPVADFLAPPHDRLRLPNPDFVPAEYAAANFDVKESGIPWSVHYAKDGMREGRPVSLLEDGPKPFPAGTAELRREFPAAPAVHRRTAVFASYSGNGRIPETVLYYLRGLREVVDNIVFVANCPVFPDEAAKLDGLVRLAVFRHHGGYDFGSYKIGWNEAKALGLLEPGVCDELVVCNDSCYGPVFPFSESFAEMERRNRAATPGTRSGFWGMASMRLFGNDAVQSYFYVFSGAVLESGALDLWFGRMEAFRDRGRIVRFCEAGLTAFLARLGFRWDSFVPESFHAEMHATPTKHPLRLLRDFRMPLVKAKALRGDCLDDPAATFEFVVRSNPALGALLPKRTENGGASSGGARAPSLPRAAREGHAVAMEEAASALRSAGRPVRVLFLSAAADPFPGADLAGRLGGDPAFAVAVAVVPDLRLSSVRERFALMRSARAALSARLPAANFLRAERDSFGEWNDLAADADVVVYGTAENASDFRYNPHWAVGRRFLPVLFFDRRTAGPYPLQKEFARQNYAYFWKVFFSDREAFDLYAKHSIRKGANAVFAEDESAVLASFPFVGEFRNASRKR